MMKKSLFPTLLLLLTLPLLTVACTDQEEKEAKQLIEEGKKLMTDGQYSEAIRMMDSLHHTFPTAVEARKAALELSRHAQREQDRRDSAFIAPNLEQAMALADSLYAHFKMVTVPDMPDETILRYKGYDPSTTSDQPFLDIYIDYNGDLVMVAGLSATHPWRSNSILIQNIEANTFVLSDTLPYDGGLNYRYENLGRYYERLTFTKDDSKNLARFFALVGVDAPIEVVWGLESGKKGPKLMLSNRAKEAISASFRYYNALAEIVEMQTQLNQIEARKAKARP